MTGPGSINAMAEMHKHTEEYALKVRSELSRIGFCSGELEVLRQGPYLQLRYLQQQIVLVAPREVLSLLHKVPRGTSDEEVWAQILDHAQQMEKERSPIKGWLATVIVSLVIMGFFLIFVKIF